MEKERKWSVEYSINQNCFHVDYLNYTLLKNLKNAFIGNNVDYKIIGIFDTQDDADNFANECRKRMEND